MDQTYDRVRREELHAKDLRVRVRLRGLVATDDLVLTHLRHFFFVLLFSGGCFLSGGKEGRKEDQEGVNSAVTEDGEEGNGRNERLLSLSSRTDFVPERMTEGNNSTE